MSYAEFVKWQVDKGDAEVAAAMGRVKWNRNNRAGQALQSKDGFSLLTSESSETIE